MAPDQRRFLPPRRPLAAVLLAAAALVAAAPAAQASPRDIPTPVGFGLGLGLPFGGGSAAAGNVGMTGCGTSHGAEGQGGTGGIVNTACSGVGDLVFIGPSSTVATAIGPTIISPGFAGVVTVSNGDVALGP
jgi:hypothetical protein